MKELTRKSKKLVAVLLAATAVMSFAACGKEEKVTTSTSEQVDLQTASQDTESSVSDVVENETKDTLDDPDYAFRYILNNNSEITTTDFAIALGAFEEEGLKVEQIGVAGGGAISIETIASGEADIGNAAIPAYLNAIASGSRIKVFYGGPAASHAQDPSNQILVAADSDIQSAEDLLGKTVAVGAKGAMWEYIVRLYMDNAGLSADDLDMIIVPNTQHEQVLKSNQVDAVVDNTPFADNLINGGTARTLANYFDVVGEEEAGYGWGFIINTDVLASRPADAIEKLVAAYIKTDEWVESHPDEARELVAQILEEREQNVELADYWHPIKLVNHGLWSDTHVQKWIDFLVKDGTLDEGEVNASDVFTNEYNPYAQ